MRVLGFEVAKFADLNRQHVSLAPGVNIVAGKNNIGKSAILLAMMFSEASAKKYANQESNVSVICEPKDEDGPFIEDPSTNKALNLPLGSWLRLEFRFGPPAPQFTGAYLNSPILPKESLVLPAAQGQRLVLQSNGRSHRQIPQGRLANGISQARDLFDNAIYISPHRVVQSVMPMAEQKKLPSNGAELSAYLMDIRGRNQAMFEQVQDAYLDMFPEFSAINTPMNSTSVSIQLQLRNGDRRPLSSCGTGLEQMLVLLTNVICASKDQLILLDEPHNFLFPTVERKFLKVLSTLPDKYFVLATHSAISINSVTPDRITYIERPGQPYFERQSRTQMTDLPQILHELGYRNSDLLFHDALIFVEGPSDSELLLTLLRKAVKPGDFRFDDRVGCPDLAGTAEYRSGDEIQKDVLREEKLMASIGRGTMPHCYLFDGDKAEHRPTLERTRANGVAPIKFTFLKRYEIENYLLCASAIARAVNQELSVLGESADISEADVAAELRYQTNNDPDNPLPHEETNRMFPKALAGANEIRVKGSRVLEKIYENHKLTYHKSKSGKLILEFVELTQEMKMELEETARELSNMIEAPSA